MISSIRFRSSGRKTFFSSSRDAAFHLVVREPLLVGEREAERLARDLPGTDVRRHDHDRAAEVDLAALRVGQLPLLQDLEQDVEDVRVRLLDLVEQEHRVRLAPHGLRELAALVVADVAGRGADEPGHGSAPCTPTRRPGSSRPRRRRGTRRACARVCLPDARGAEEDERAGRPLGP